MRARNGAYRRTPSMPPINTRTNHHIITTKTMMSIFRLKFFGQIHTDRYVSRVALATLAALACSVAPALAAPPEAPVTEAPSALTGTTATLNGELNPGVGVEELAYRFFYSPGGECNGFQVLPVEPPFPLAAGNHKKVSLPVTGLEASTTYWVCLLAINPAEEAEQTFGSTVEFKTPASKPLVSSESAVGVTPFAASLVAEVNPENQSTSCVFEYGLVVGEYRAPCEPATFEGGGPVGVSFALSKLTPATKYHYRVVVKNATGETKGPEETFETLTLEKPILEGEHTGLVTAPETTIEGQLDPNYQPITGCEVQYTLQGTGFGAPQSVACQPNNPPENTFGEGANFVPLIATLSGLQPGASYEYRILATNNSGTIEGPVQLPFTVPLPPLLTIGEAQSITRTTATLPGTVNPEGLETTYYYQYGTTTSYGGNAPSVQGVAAGSGSSAVPAPIGISGLVPATTYHYRLAATNADGTTYSTDKTFTTALRTPPVVSTGEASNVTLTTATVAGTINPEGLETSYELDLGIDTTYGTSIYGEAGSANTPTQITLSLQNLAPGSTYHYRMVAINSDGRIPGADRTFTTPTYSNPIVQPPGLPLLQTPAITFPTETTNTAKPTVKKHTKKSKHKRPKHKKKHKKKK
jgi:hypothetical protein